MEEAGVEVSRLEGVVELRESMLEGVLRGVLEEESVLIPETGSPREWSKLSRLRFLTAFFFWDMLRVMMGE